MRRDSFERIVNDDTFSVSEGGRAEFAGPCPEALAFEAWIETTRRRYEPLDAVLRLNQLRLAVLIRYAQLIRRLGNDHPLGYGPHLCLHQVFDSVVLSLDEIELSLEPPRLVDTIVVSKPVRRRRFGPLDGLLFGELEDDE